MGINNKDPFLFRFYVLFLWFSTFFNPCSTVFCFFPSCFGMVENLTFIFFEWFDQKWLEIQFWTPKNFAKKEHQQVPEIHVGTMDYMGGSHESYRRTCLRPKKKYPVRPTNPWVVQNFDNIHIFGYLLRRTVLKSPKRIMLCDPLSGSMSVQILVTNKRLKSYDLNSRVNKTIRWTESWFIPVLFLP